MVGLFGFGMILWFTGRALLFIMPILVFFFGIIGLVKDRKVAMAIVGMSLELVYVIFVIIGYFMTLAYPI
ncbi:MAG: hypothetical protein ACFE96_19280 [Candidatus Hermodarchaeota archaeon]